MAQRRMFSLRVIDSARFIKMPIDAQLLYFHLGLHADDDGIVEAYPIMRILGTSEDNLKVLVAKSFIVVLNEDLVSFVTDWKEHNLIRSDRKVDSIYQDLLVRLLPDAEIQQPRKRADTKSLARQPKKALDVQWTSNGQHRLGKVRLGKVNTIKAEKIINYNEDDVAMTKALMTLVKKNYPFVKGSSGNKDYEEMNRLHRIDGHSYETIEKMIEWCQDDSFWRQNIRSVNKLRKNFESLMIKSESSGTKPQKDGTSYDVLAARKEIQKLYKNNPIKEI